MREIGFDELRELQLNILKQVDEYCNKNSIKYSLAYGTLIGAIRHKGYIPWDDDIDIMMPREDYNRFIQCFNSAYTDLQVVSPELVSTYYAPYANIYLKNTKLVEPHINHGYANLGVKIDLFPIDVVPENYKEYTKWVKRFSEINRWRNYKHISIFEGRKLSIKAIIKRAFALFIPSILLNHISKKQLKCIDKESSFVDIIVWPVYPFKRFKRESTQGLIKVPFESITVNIFKDYDDILTSYYGDYMKLPPVEQRVAKHDFVAYWTKTNN